MVVYVCNPSTQENQIHSHPQLNKKFEASQSNKKPCQQKEDTINGDILQPANLSGDYNLLDLVRKRSNFSVYGSRYFFPVLSIKLDSPCMPIKHSITELRPQLILLEEMNEQIHNEQTIYNGIYIL